MTAETTKHELLEKLLNKPLALTDADFAVLLSEVIGLTFEDIRKCVHRIYDVNENILLEESEAEFSLNKRSQKKRNKKFYTKFRRKDFDRTKGKVIVAEGDSWFEFPFFIRDIIDHLNDHKQYAIYSLAYGGDWLTNIVYEGKYVEKLSVFSPDVFLVSGGGNDLVGSDRLGIMVNAKGGCIQRYDSIEAIQSRAHALYDSVGRPTAEDVQQYFRAQDYMLSAFYSFIKIMKLQYCKMFEGIHKKFPQMKIITQAYDYPIPSPKRYWNPLSIRFYVNRFLGSGRWLFTPLMIAGITDRNLQRQILRYMIYEFNLMFAEIATTQENVFHIDCRGVAKSDKDWYDELHLKSAGYKKIALTYQHCIDSTDQTKKIYFAGLV